MAMNLQRQVTRFLRCLTLASGWISCGWLAGESLAQDQPVPAAVAEYLRATCFSCHSGSDAEAGLDLSSLTFELAQPANHAQWVLIHDRLRAGEMPPPDSGTPRPLAPIGWSTQAERSATDPQLAGDLPRRVLVELAHELAAVDRQRQLQQGRAEVRRLNRQEYEHTLRQLLSAPWLLIADRLPDDPIEHLFPKSGRRLDMSHVQMMSYLEVAEQALQSAVNAAAHPTATRRLYARDEPTPRRYLFYRTGQTAATRSVVPLDGLRAEVDVLRKWIPISVGDSDPARRDREALGVFSGTYSATTKYDFTRVNAPTDGRYRLRFKTYTFMAGPHGASGGPDEGLTGGNRDWWRPDRSATFTGYRTEPVTLYALNPSGESRWLTSFDSRPEPSVFECEVDLRQGEGIRPDATRLVRTRPGWTGNPNATAEGIPGLAMNWLEVEGPLHTQWPPASYQAVFDQLPFEISAEGQVVVMTPPDATQTARQLLDRFLRRAVGETQAVDESAVDPYLAVFTQAQVLGLDFTQAVISACAAIVCSPGFLYLEEQPGPLPAAHLERRLAYFLWNSPPDTSAVASGDSLFQRVERMLDDPRRHRFVNHFLDYWLSLRDLATNSPDATLYPEYYLDDWLLESSLLETRLYFNELLERDLPVKYLIDSDFTFVNERLAELYQLPVKEGARLWRARVPEDSPRGGLLTQASVLRITANGTTTSPVVRGAWIMERLLGAEIPPPPSGVSAVEPDIRGATTIREQLAKHRELSACNACHARFDPAGLGLENFDVCGGWREHYRGTSQGSLAAGFGKNGHAFSYRSALLVEADGQLLSGERFESVAELKQALLRDERQLARNLLQRLIVFATGCPVSFADRVQVEQMLDQAEPSQYGIRTLIHQLVASELFHCK